MVRKIPKNAKLVFKGILFDVYHWNQKLLNGKYKTFEAIRSRDIVAILPTKDDKIMVAEEERIHHPPMLGPFGGYVERGERALSAAKRELLEESGYVSDNWKLIHIYQPASITMDLKIHLFIARDCKKVSKQRLDGGERIVVKEIDFDEFVELPTISEQFDNAVGGYLTEVANNKNAREKLRKLLFD